MPETHYTIKDYAKEIVNCGYALLPCYGNNTKEERKKKVSMLKEGDPEYQTGISFDRFEKEFYKNEDTFVAIRCGDISQNMECLDFDNNFGDAKDIFQAYCAIPAVRDIIGEHNLFIEETISGGRHLVYMVSEPLTKLNQGKNLARRFNKTIEKPQVLIEIRTQGLYFVTYPSKGYVVKYGDLFDMKPITLEQRNFLIEMARSFEEFDDPKAYFAPAVQKGKSQVPQNTSDLRPGDDFDNDPNSIDEMIKMLEAEGWTRARGSEKGWCRPDKTDGSISATLGHIGDKGNVFYVFSTNAYPFEAGKCYTPFRVLTLLHYNGNFTDCARALGARGYGTKRTPTNADEGTKKWKEAKRLLTEVIKRAPDRESIDEDELIKIANKTGIELIEAQAFIEKSIDAAPEMLNFNKLVGISQAINWIKTKWEITRDSVKQTESIKKKDDNSNREYCLDDIYIDLKEEGFKISKSDVESVLNSAKIADVNPIYKWFNNLPVYKESDPNWIKEYASYWQCDDEKMQPFWEDMFEKHLVRALHCAFNGLENRYCVVLLGKQEAGKSTYIRNLCFDENYYTQKDMFTSDHKDNLIAQFENFFWNIEEIDGYTNAQLNKLKAYISMPYEKVRDFFGRKAKIRYRIVTYWGTGNKDNILTDETGNSRFLVFRGKIRSHDYNNMRTKVCRVPIDMVWAQAMYLYNKGNEYNYDLSSADKAIRDSNNTKYEVGNDTESTILDLFEPGNYFWSVTRMARRMRKQSGGSIFTGQQITTSIKKLKDRGLADFQEGEVSGQKGYFVSCKTDDDGNPNLPSATMKPLKPLEGEDF